MQFFPSKGPWNLVRIYGIMNSMKYQEILNMNLAVTARKLKLSRIWIFQQDNVKNKNICPNQCRNG